MGSMHHRYTVCCLGFAVCNHPLTSVASLRYQIASYTADAEDCLPCCQCLYSIFPRPTAGDVVRAPCGVMHGKTSPVYHTNVGILEGLEK
jgi:hypothetical protein